MPNPLQYKKGQKFRTKCGDCLTVKESVEYWEKCALVYSEKRRCNIIVWVSELVACRDSVANVMEGIARFP